MIKGVTCNRQLLQTNLYVQYVDKNAYLRPKMIAVDDEYSPLLGMAISTSDSLSRRSWNRSTLAHLFTIDMLFGELGKPLRSLKLLGLDEW